MKSEDGFFLKPYVDTEVCCADCGLKFMELKLKDSSLVSVCDRCLAKKAQALYDASIRKVEP